MIASERVARFLADLKRRGIFKIAVLYVAIAWGLIQAASVTLPAFNAPIWMMRGLLVVAFSGFPVTLVLAWIFEFTTHGIKVTVPLDSITEPYSHSRKWWVRPLIGTPLIASVVGGSVWLWSAHLADRVRSD